MGAGLARQVTLQATALSVLDSLSDSLSRQLDPESALRETLSECLDAAGLSVGSILLRDAGDRVDNQGACRLGGPSRLGRTHRNPSAGDRPRRLDHPLAGGGARRRGLARGPRRGLGPRRPHHLARRGAGYPLASVESGGPRRDGGRGVRAGGALRLDAARPSARHGPHVLEARDGRAAIPRAARERERRHRRPDPGRRHPRGEPGWERVMGTPAFANRGAERRRSGPRGGPGRAACRVREGHRPGRGLGPPDTVSAIGRKRGVPRNLWNRGRCQR